MSDEFVLQPAKRHEVKVRVAISGPSGSGKTYGALLIAAGLASSHDKIALIDAENRRALAYADLVPGFMHLPLKDYSPENYIKAIKACDAAGMEVVILDGITPEWKWCLEAQANAGGRYQDWKAITPRHEKFMKAIQNNPMFTIACMRRKKDYQLSKNESTGRPEVIKAGMKEEAREDTEYEFDVHLALDNKTNLALAEKDITNLFITPEGNFPFKITKETGLALLKWSRGEDAKPTEKGEKE